MALKNICVYCGSSPGRLDLYADAARKVAEALVKRDLGLVYGGASVGIMGVVADHVLALGGRVYGVIPESLASREIAHSGLTELHITRSMHERKTMMEELADGFIALPGGIGTLEELFEIWTWAQLGLHHKPCGLLNVAGYFDALHTFLDHTVAEGFVQPVVRSMLMVENDPDLLLERFADYRSPRLKKWVEEGET
jgi:uncharacterized protein (TIGR00730 family)